jgi:hypothetical protein
MCSLFHITLLYFPWFLNRVHHTHSNTQQIRHPSAQCSQCNTVTTAGAVHRSPYSNHTPCDHYNLSQASVQHSITVPHHPLHHCTQTYLW